MVTYPGLPGPEISGHLDFDASRAHYAAGTEFTIGRISMVANTGTYLDTPAHRFREGHDLHGLPLQRCAMLPAVVIDGDGAIEADAFDDIEIEGCAVLLRTGWDRHWGTEQYADPDHPHLTEAGAERLVAGGVALAGIDSVNIDDTPHRRAPRPHRAAGCRSPGRRASDRIGRRAGDRSTIHRRASGGPGTGDLPGTRVRDHGIGAGSSLNFRCSAGGQ